MNTRIRIARMAIAVVSSLSTVAFAACGESAQHPAEIPLEVSGSETEPFETNRGAAVELTRAELAFGPLYLCAGAQAGELCETARLEWLESATVDLLSPRSREVGTLVGVTGPVRSYMYDLGYSSVLTAETPLELEAASELGGASLVVEGLATLDGVTRSFQAKVAVLQGADVERGVPVVRKSSNESFEHDVRGDETALRVRFDARPWVETIDFEGLIAEQCPDASESCVALELGPETAAHRELVIQLGAGQRPAFTWEDGR